MLRQHRQYNCQKTVLGSTQCYNTIKMKLRFGKQLYQCFHFFVPLFVRHQGNKKLAPASSAPTSQPISVEHSAAPKTAIFEEGSQRGDVVNNNEKTIAAVTQLWHRRWTVNLIVIIIRWLYFVDVVAQLACRTLERQRRDRVVILFMSYRGWRGKYRK